MLRMLLLVNADRIECAAPAAGPADLDLLAPKYTIEVTPDGRLIAVGVNLSTLDSPTFLRRFLLDRARTRVADAWREGLIHLEAIPKTVALARITAAARYPAELRRPLADLPAEMARAVLVDAATSVAPDSRGPSIHRHSV